MKENAMNKSMHFSNKVFILTNTSLIILYTERTHVLFRNKKELDNKVIILQFLKTSSFTSESM